MWCSIYFSWTAATDDDEMKEKEHKKDKKGWRVRGREMGCCWLQGSGGGMRAKKKKGEEERGSKTQNIITRSTRRENAKLLLEMVGSKKAEDVREQREDERHKDQGWQSHSHMEDGLLVSHHFAISYRQGVIATLQVKILKCQLDYLDSSRDIARTTINKGYLNAFDIRCRGETPSHLWLSILLSLCLSSANLSWSYVWHNSICGYARLVCTVLPRDFPYCSQLDTLPAN